MAFEGSKELVYEICDRLRDNRTTQHLYVDQAEQIADQLQIEKSVSNAIDFGDRDTFSFEERGFLQNTPSGHSVILMVPVKLKRPIVHPFGSMKVSGCKNGS